MPCYHPLKAYKTTAGEVVFTELKRHGDIIKTLELPCGQCIGCRLERSRKWAMRCVHEASMYKRNCFVTLTYDDEHLPHRGQLTHKDFELFMKRLRKHAGKTLIKFYMGGEYGTLNDRPHYHAAIFNWDWDDKTYFKTTGSKEKIYTSEKLQKLWPWGHSSTGDLTFESAAYIARYCLQKVTGERAEEHYKRYDYLGEYQLNPEYNQMSNGIGADWLKFHEKDVYTNDYVIIRGEKCNVPAYYDKLLKRKNPELMQEFKDAREWKGEQNWENNTPERLRVREIVKIAQTNQLKRGEI
jgi:hypothetical protein